MPGVKYFQGSSIYLSEKTVAYAGQPLESAPIRLGAGAATALEVLDAEQSLAAQEEKLALSLKNARQIQQLRHLRCQAGSSPLTAWLDAQENRRMAKGNLLENGLNQLQNHIPVSAPKRRT